MIQGPSWRRSLQASESLTIRWTRDYPFGHRAGRPISATLLRLSMRILNVHNRYQSSQPSGETARVEQEGELLAAAGHNVEMLFVDNDQIAEWDGAKKATLPGRTVWSRSSYRLVRQATRRLRPDVVHVHNYVPLLSPSAMWAGRRAGAAVVHTLANYRLMCPVATFLRDGHPCEDCLGRRFAWPGVVHGCYRSRPATATVATMATAHDLLGTWRRAVDLYLIASAFGRDKYLEGGFRPDRIMVKPNTAPDRGVVEPRSGRHLVFLGRLSREKDVGTLLRAWAVARLPADVVLRVIGDGEEGPALHELASSLGVSEKIEFTGLLNRAAAADQVSNALGLVSPSLAYEVSSLSVIEALAAGVPVIVPDSGAQAELAEDGVNGFRFTPKDAAGLAVRLERLVDPETNARLGRAARVAFEQNHSGAAVLAKLEEGYELAIRRSRNRGDRLRSPGQHGQQ